MDIRVVGSGVDWLTIGFLIDSYLDVADFEVMTQAKIKAGEKIFNSKGYPVTWFGSEFSMKASGGSGYEWIMINDDVLVRIAKEARGGIVFPEVFVIFFSQFLWTEGMDSAVEKAMQWLSKWAVIGGTKVSRCDLCIDLAMPFPRINIQNEVVTRARNKTEYTLPIEIYVAGRRSTGYRIGSGDILARFYDKSYEIVISQKEWYKDNWLEKGWDGETNIARCELQCRRKFLKEMGVDTYEDLKERLPDIWRYFTHDWLKVCYPGSDRNQSRWEVKEYWKVIQEGFSLFGQALGVLRYKVKQVRYDHLMQQARGVLVSACAVEASAHGVNEALFKVRKELLDILLCEDYRKDVIARQALVGNMDKPHTHLVDEIMRLGGEIESVDFD